MASIESAINLDSDDEDAQHVEERTKYNLVERRHVAAAYDDNIG